MVDMRVLETHLLFGPTDHCGAAPEIVTLRYEKPMPRAEADVIEDAIREGWHTGQMRVQARRALRLVYRCGGVGPGDVRILCAQRCRGCGVEVTVAEDGRVVSAADQPEAAQETSSYTETGHELAAGEAERLRAQLKAAEQCLSDVETQRDAALTAVERARAEADQAVARELEANKELASLRININRLINRNADRA